jgi:hypothetical protein
MMMLTATRTRPSWRSALRWLIVLLLGVTPCAQSSAHALKQSYVFLRIFDDAVEGRVEINIEDLNRILGSSLPTDHSVTRADVEPHAEQLRAYLHDRVTLRPDGVQIPSLPLTDFEVIDPGLAQYVAYDFKFSDLPTAPTYVDVNYAVLFDTYPDHRAFLVVENNWKTGTLDNEMIISLGFAPGRTADRLDLSHSAVWRGFVELVRQGVHHIWIGIDHILFLVALLLPSVVRRERGAWSPAPEFRPALIYAVKIVTVFTVAHTVTLSLAALGTISLPSRLVESVIALSIAIAAADVIYPIFHKRIWLVVFAFGLFHGFGFASVLGEIGIPRKYMVHSLLGFNLGVEIGQLAIVCALFPILYLARRLWIYPKVILRYGAAMLIVVSMYWFIERGFGVDLPAGAVINAVRARFIGAVS